MAPADIDRLDHIARVVRTALPGAVRVESGNGGLLCLAVDSAQGRAQVYFQGAHVAAWHPAGSAHPVLWLSRSSYFEPGRPIRGGVPICFPWFGPHREDPSAPAHGFARLREWTLTEAHEDPDGTVRLALELAGEDLSPLWPHRFRAVHRIQVGRSLRMALEVRNEGTGSFTFEEALHTYLGVSDIRRVEITGLEGADYLDKMAASARVREGSGPIRFSGETDRIYVDTHAACTVRDSGLSRRIAVSKEGSDATVVWNPWIAKARAMPDFGDDEWTEMVCVETCNVNVHAVTLAPGGIHVMTAVVEADHE